MQTNYLGSVVVPDGYSGDTCKLFLCYDSESKKTLAVHRNGFFTSGVPAAVDSEEATWLIKNHPSCGNMNDFSVNTKKQI